MKESCAFCNKEFEDMAIKKYDNWEVQLFRDDQYYIGRLAIVFRDRHIVDISELRPEEWMELHEIIRDLVDAVDNVLDPDLYNYSSIGSHFEHLHFHFIPRYKSVVKFKGQLFYDEYWGKTYQQDYERYSLHPEKEQALIQEIREELNK